MNSSMLCVSPGKAALLRGSVWKAGIQKAHHKVPQACVCVPTKEGRQERWQRGVWCVVVFFKGVVVSSRHVTKYERNSPNAAGMLGSGAERVGGNKRSKRCV